MNYNNSVPCPVCGAPIGVDCRTKSGSPLSYRNHKVRGEELPGSCAYLASGGAFKNRRGQYWAGGKMVRRSA